MDSAIKKPLAVLMTAILLVSAVGMVGIVGAQTQTDAGNGPTATVSFADQQTDGTTVTVESVNVSEGGFVAIHDDSLLDGAVLESVIGVSEYLEPGLHENVTVTLYDVPGATFDRTALSEDETLIAMPHLDTNGNETYDFVATNGTDDGAYVANGSAVVDAANVTLPEPTTGESFTVSNLTAPDVVERNETVDVAATITNPNDVAETQEVTFRFDGEVLVREDVTLEAGESTEFNTTVDTTGLETGTAFHGVYTREDGAAARLLVVETIQSFGVSNLTAPANATVDEPVSVTATVTNPNAFAIEQPVEYRFDGALVDARNVDLDGGESTTVEFELDARASTPGTYIHSVFSVDFGENALITLEPADEGDTGDDADEGDDADDADEGDEAGEDGSDGADGADEGDDVNEGDDSDDAGEGTEADEDDADETDDGDDADGDDADGADDGDDADESDESDDADDGDVDETDEGDDADGDEVDGADDGDEGDASDDANEGDDADAGDDMDAGDDVDEGDESAEEAENGDDEETENEE
ncbi:MULTISPECIES: DUF7282 domain-containing protein [Haloferacaceae]|uniref:DUF7282 domain-containing protein n=1 Tax=Halorubrum glutamatedens TaxID=2707018 RepID=A0ABD5QNE0_9EURY|nr:hypothetical protein [Halobellus captivus]